MRRDIANEVVVAIVAVAVIAFALSFGILLTLSSNTGGAGGERVTQTVTEAAVSVGRTLTIVRIDSPVSVSATPNTSMTTTPTEELTIFTLLAPTQTATRPPAPTRATTTEPTTVKPTVTIEPMASVEVTETVEATAKATDADTVDSTNTTTIVVTASPSAVASRTPTAAHTSAASSTVEPTATFTATLKHTFTPTATLTVAPTATKPTVTPTLTPTHTATHTATVKATETPTATSSPIPTGTPLTAPPTIAPGAVTQVGGVCQPRTDWPRYLMATGDTLASIAQKVGITEAELSTANCLDSSRVLIVGDVLFVPQLPVLPTPANGFPLPTLRKLGCVDEGFADISNLYPSQRLSGSFVILGSALLDSTFTHYVLEIRSHADLTFGVFSQGNKTVNNGELARHDTSQYEDGIYWLRLIVRDATGIVAPNGVCVVPVAFD